ncbi:MAG: PilZ domain-containing protein [Candidatus Polarisedimenticolia bacterium]
MTRPTQQSRRSRRRIQVRYGPDAPRFIGYTRNFSRTGVMIAAIRVFPPGTVLDLEIGLPSGKVMVRGRVVWARQGSVQWMATGRVGMGLRFVDPPEGLLDLVQGGKTA